MMIWLLAICALNGALGRVALRLPHDYSGALHHPLLPNGYYNRPPYSYGYHAESSAFSPPGSYYDSIYGIYKPFPGGGVPVRVDYNNRCSHNYVGIKPHPDQRQYYYVCHPNCVIFSKCSNSETFNPSTGRCTQRLSTNQPTVCHKEGRFPYHYDCKLYYKCDKSLRPCLYGCPAGTIFSPSDSKCIPGDKCPGTDISNSGSYIPKSCELKFPRCTEEGTFRSPSDCALYYTCRLQDNGNYLQTRFRCHGENSYDNKLHICRPHFEVNCQNYVRVADLAYTPLAPFYPYIATRPKNSAAPLDVDDFEIESESKVDEIEIEQSLPRQHRRHHHHPKPECNTTESPPGTIAENRIRFPTTTRLLFTTTTTQPRLAIANTILKTKQPSTEETTTTTTTEPTTTPCTEEEHTTVEEDSTTDTKLHKTQTSKPNKNNKHNKGKSKLSEQSKHFWAKEKELKLKLKPKPLEAFSLISNADSPDYMNDGPAEEATEAQLRATTTPKWLSRRYAAKAPSHIYSAKTSTLSTLAAAHLLQKLFEIISTTPASGKQQLPLSRKSKDSRDNHKPTIKPAIKTTVKPTIKLAKEVALEPAKELAKEPAKEPAIESTIKPTINPESSPLAAIVKPFASDSLLAANQKRSATLPALKSPDLTTEKALNSTAGTPHDAEYSDISADYADEENEVDFNRTNIEDTTLPPMLLLSETTESKPQIETTASSISLPVVANVSAAPIAIVKQNETTTEADYHDNYVDYDYANDEPASDNEILPPADDLSAQKSLLISLLKKKLTKLAKKREPLTEPTEAITTTTEKATEMSTEIKTELELSTEPATELSTQPTIITTKASTEKSGNSSEYEDDDAYADYDYVNDAPGSEADTAINQDKPKSTSGVSTETTTATSRRHSEKVAKNVGGQLDFFKGHAKRPVDDKFLFKAARPKLAAMSQKSLEAISLKRQHKSNSNARALTGQDAVIENTTTQLATTTTSTTDILPAAATVKTTTRTTQRSSSLSLVEQLAIRPAHLLAKEAPAAASTLSQILSLGGRPLLLQAHNQTVHIRPIINPVTHVNRSLSDSEEADEDTEKVPELTLKVFEPIDLKIVYCPRDCDQNHDHSYNPADNHNYNCTDYEKCHKPEPLQKHSVDLKWKPLKLSDTIGVQTIT